VQERKTFREFAGTGVGPTNARSLGSLGDLLRDKLGLQEHPIVSAEGPVAPSTPSSAPSERPVERPTREDVPGGVVRRRR
jgi:hypothetical protein